MIYIGDKKLKNCYLGDEKIGKVYRGDELLFDTIPVFRLPEGYTELEYISCSYGQRIDSGIVPTNKTRILMDLDHVDFLNPNNINSSKFFFQSYYWTGTGSSASYYYLAMMGSNNSTKKVSAYMGRYTSSTLGVTTINGFQVNSRVKIDVDLASHSISVNETVTSVGSNGTTHANMPSLMLFGMASGSSAAYSGIQADIYSCQIYDGEEVKRDYVPCTDPNGVSGLYDLVSKTFFGSASSTAFVPGPAL